MKKYYLLLIALSIAVMTFGQETDPRLKMFKGIGTPFAGKENSLFVPMNDQMVYAYNALKNTAGLKLVGHSQGGLRAVGLAGYMKNKGEGKENNIDTVISIGSLVLGFSPLAQGTYVLKNKIDDAADTLRKGWFAATSLSSHEQPPDVNDVKNGGGVEGLIDAFGIDASGIKDMVSAATTPGNNSVSDMHPGSIFIWDDIYGPDYKMEPFTYTIPGFFGTPPQTFTVYIAWPLSSSKWRLPSNPKYGFVVGEDSDVLRMAKQHIRPDAFYKDPHLLKSAYVSAVYGAELAWWVVEGREGTLRALAALKFWDQTDFNHHDGRWKRAIDLKHAARWGHEWANQYMTKFSEILGTASPSASGSKYGHDSFIPVKDQYIDVAAFGGKYVDEVTKGKFTGTGVGFNHYNETVDPAIWGTGSGAGLDKATVERSGILHKWLYGRNDSTPAYMGEIVR